MKRYLFPIFITLLGLTTAYLFYALWHSEEINPSVMDDTPSSQPQPKKLSQKKPIPKKSDLSTVSELTGETDQTEMATETEKDIPKMMEIQSDVENLTLQEMEAKTEEVYESLVPDDYEETMQEAEAAFERLDETVEAMDEKLAEEMQAAEEAQEEQMVQEETVQKDIDEETQTEADLPMPNSEDEEIVVQEEEGID